MIVFHSESFAGEHKWHAGVFIGATTNFDAEHTDFTLGADIEYRLGLANHLFGVGAIGDMVFAEHKEMLLMGAVFIHPVSSLKFIFGNGVAVTTVKLHNVEETENTHVLRIGADYDFHLSNITVSPTINYDIIHDHGSLAYGLTFGLGF